MPEFLQEIRAFSTVDEFDPMPYEVDFTGYLSNTAVVRWMEVLRVRLMRTHFSEIDAGAREHLSVITRTEIDYLDTVRFGEPIQGNAWIVEVASARWRIAFEFRHLSKNRLAIGANQVGTFLDPQSFRPVRVPEVIRRKFFSCKGAMA